MSKKNTTDVWDKCWDRPISVEEDRYNLLKEEKSIRFQRIEKLILNKYNNISKLKVIEIGAGAGTNAALLAKKEADVTILDYSKKALQRSREFFDRNNLKADFIEGDALKLPNELCGQYDISMSFGLSEHFKGEQRFLINKSHFDVLKSGGISIISVPNSLNLPYRIYKLLAETLGFWKVGEEYPFTRKELDDICKKLHIKNYSFIGDSIYWSLNFVNPFKIVKKIIGTKPNFDTSKIRLEKGSPIDEYFSYALVLCAFKE